MIRIYHQAPLKVGDLLPLTDTASHHLLTVLRIHQHEHLSLFNGQGGEFEAIVERIEKRTVWVTLKKFNPIERESTLPIHLGQSIARAEKMDWIIQKAVELGVTEITPLLTERCGVQLPLERWEKRLAHWHKVIVSACEQCGRNTLPILHDKTALPSWLTRHASACKIAIHPFATHTLSQLPPTRSVTLLIGPEGGFSDSEIIQIQKADFHLIRLGPRILRTETAPLAMIAALQTQYGDFSIA